MSRDFDYDPMTDSLYVKVRRDEAVDNRIVGDDFVIDLGSDGEPVERSRRPYRSRGYHAA